MKVRHVSLMMQLLYTGKVNVDGGEGDRKGLLDLLQTLDIKINPASLSKEQIKEQIKGRKGRKSVSAASPETVTIDPATEETPTTSGEFIIAEMDDRRMQ